MEMPISCRVLHFSDRSSFLGGGTGGLLRSRSCDVVSGLDVEPGTTLRRVVSATLSDSFFPDGDYEEDEDFARRLQDLALRCQAESAAQNDAFFAENSGDRRDYYLLSRDWDDSALGVGISAPQFSSALPSPTAGSATPPPWLGIRPEPPDWVDEGQREILPGAVSVERNGASVDLPLSLRILKRKKRWESEGWIREASETAACSVQKALSSLVFIIRELQSYALQLRSGTLVCDDSLREIMFRVHREVHGSFCWLFGHIFASTPTLMVSVMLLLANFTVYSMSHTVAALPVAMSPLLSPSPAITSTFEAIEESRHTATPSAESFLSGWHGGGGGGSKAGRVAGASDDGRWIEGLSLLNQRRTILHEGISSLPAVEERGMAVVPVEEESRV